MGFGLNWLGAAAGYQAYKDDQRQQAEDARKAAADADLAKQRAFQDEERSRQRYDWSEIDRVRNNAKNDAVKFAQMHPFSDDDTGATAAPSTPTAPTPAPASAASAPSPAGASQAVPADGSLQSYPVADPSSGIAPTVKGADLQTAPLDADLAGAPSQPVVADNIAATAPAAQPVPNAPLKGADLQTPPVDTSLAGAPPQPVVAPDTAAAPQAAPAAQASAATPAGAPAGDAPALAAPSGIPKARAFGTVIDMQRYVLDQAARRGDVTPQAYAQARGFLDKMRSEGITQALDAFARGDYEGGIRAYNDNGIQNGAKFVSAQDSTVTLPNGATMPTKLVTIDTPNGRAVIDTTRDRYSLLGLKDQLDQMDKAADRENKTAQAKASQTHADAAMKQAGVMEGYRADQAENMREQRRLQEKAIDNKATLTAEQAANWTKEADSYLQNATKSKDQDGNEVYDGDGFTFAKTVGLDYARQHGGDAMSGAGVAIGVNNQIKQIATANVAKDPKLVLANELRRLRSEYVQHATRAAQAATSGAQASGASADFARSPAAAAAQRAGSALGVDPNVILGQWGLETGWGKSIIPGTNNLGNIKDFSGGGVAATDNQTGSVDKYAAFANPDAFADRYVELIRSKYPGAVGAGSDAARFAGALQAGGYAEDPDYAAKVQASYQMLANRAPRPAQAQGKPTPAAPPHPQDRPTVLGDSIDVRNDPALKALDEGIRALDPNDPKNVQTLMKLGTARNARLAQLQDNYGSRSNLISQ